ncbi:RrF2 family transcriptional regulator [Algoriphagus marinus]|uniref:RrF2 family transcriptional regulator n=1 Tax=Algoriphagus marinus TaxID=1925762 RepID=UPI00094BBD9E|nr:Rrf2 family transcriptional regulator [Algoriphagus marinus]
MLFSKSLQYAIKAVIFIQTKSNLGEKPGAVEICQGIDAPKAFIAKILQTLVKEHIIGSNKGPGGGFFLDDYHSNKTLKNILVAIDGPSIIKGCALGLPTCSDLNPCPLHNQIKLVREETINMLESKTIKEFGKEVEEGETILQRELKF